MAEHLLTELDYIAWLRVEGLLSAAKRWLKRNPPPKDWNYGKYAYAYTEMPVWPWTHRDQTFSKPLKQQQPEPAEASAVSEVTE